jgi:phosphoribosylaminoimidazole-succinocarboxamide synthase
MIGDDLAEQVRDVAIRIYERAAEYALGRGIIIADTKFEFGQDQEGRLYLIDEILTPDSSRFWPLSECATTWIPWTGTRRRPDPDYRRRSSKRPVIIIGRRCAC